MSFGEARLSREHKEIIEAKPEDMLNAVAGKDMPLSTPASYPSGMGCS